ncbi:hypothetical protein, partial [Pseudacidovorax intermedius]|uniref:hypothetical protein n=1 Tax=Pseudacidovorax intermedius TaxID=433924 RepID=UPI0005BB0A53
LGAALAELAQDEAQRRALAQAAQQRALQYTPTAMATAYLGLYQALVRDRACHPAIAPALRGHAAPGPRGWRASTPSL